MYFRHQGEAKRALERGEITQREFDEFVEADKKMRMGPSAGLSVPGNRRMYGGILGGGLPPASPERGSKKIA